jgi:hypothetical protein
MFVLQVPCKPGTDKFLDQQSDPIAVTILEITWTCGDKAERKILQEPLSSVQIVWVPLLCVSFGLTIFNIREVHYNNLPNITL